MLVPDTGTNPDILLFSPKMSGLGFVSGTRIKMKPEIEQAGASAGKIAARSKTYAGRDEVEKAIRNLSDEDHAKLLMIAKSFCRRRRFSSSVMEPEELLSEAVMKSLQLYKKWNTKISIVRHLDRAMENISGHLAGERSKILPFPDGLRPDGPEPVDDEVPMLAEEVAESAEKSNQLLASVFGDDDEAKAVFVMRANESTIPEILTKHRLTEQQYETITRRIRRKLFQFLNPQN